MQSDVLAQLDRFDLTNEELAIALGLPSLAKMCAARKGDRRKDLEKKEKLKKRLKQQSLDLDDRLEWLIKHSCKRMDVERSELGNYSNRQPKVCLARHIIIYVLRVVEHKSYPAIVEMIAERVRRMNHSSAIRAVNKISYIVGAGGSEKAYIIDDIARKYALLKT